MLFIDLSGLSGPGLVPGAVIGVFGLRAAPGRGPVGVLVTRLSDRDVLPLVAPVAVKGDRRVRGCAA